MPFYNQVLVPFPPSKKRAKVDYETYLLAFDSMDHQWFTDKLKDLKLSQRQLAKKMEIDPASVSYMLRGKRKMSMLEAQSLADIFKVQTTEVMRKAGIAVTDDIQSIPIAGHAGRGSLVTLLPPGTHDMAQAPADTPRGSYCIQKRDISSANDAWLYFVSGTVNKPDDVLSKACLVALADGIMMMAIVHPGYKKDRYNLILMGNGHEVMENQDLKWASRVLWIQPT